MHDIQRYLTGFKGVNAVDNHVEGLSKTTSKSSDFYTRSLQPIASMWQNTVALHRFIANFRTGLPTGFGGKLGRFNLLSPYFCTVSTDTMMSTALFFKKKGY